MIKLFRNIRKKLLNEGKTANYLKYAIGEILLVVIGILIALNINNWNQARKDRAFEITMLKDVKESIDGPNGLQRFIQRLNMRLSLADSSANEIKKLLGKENVPNDSLMKHMYGINTGILFTYNSGPYEAIKSVGLDKITNDSIRTTLSGTYDFALPRLKELLEGHYIKLSDEAANLQSKFLQPAIIQTAGGNVDIRLVAADNLSKKPDFLKFVRLRHNAAQHAMQRLDSIKPQITRLQQLLDKELKAQTN